MQMSLPQHVNLHTCLASPITNTGGWPWKMQIKITKENIQRASQSHMLKPQWVCNLTKRNIQCNVVFNIHAQYICMAGGSNSHGHYLNHPPQLPQVLTATPSHSAKSPLQTSIYPHKPFSQPTSMPMVVLVKLNMIFYSFCAQGFRGASHDDTLWKKDLSLGIEALRSLPIQQIINLISWGTSSW